MYSFVCVLDLYSVLPPLESFMEVNGFTRRENFYKVMSFIYH